jgi:ABC-type uncharacterized transport system permease subunit
MTLILFIASALFYGGASFAYGAERVEDGPRSSHEPGIERYGRLLLLLAALAHVAAVGAQCVDGDHPLKNIFLATSFGALIAVGGYLVISRGHRLDALGPVMAPLGLVGLSLGVVFSEVGRDAVPGAAAVGSAHVFFASAGLAGFMLAATVAGLYLVVERRLRTKRFRPGRQGMSLTGLDRLHHRLVLLVTPVFTLAIVTGVLWILEMGGPERLLQSRLFEIAAAGIAWLVSVSLLISRATRGTRGRRSAWLTMLAFLAIVLIVVSYGVRA